MSEDKKIRPTSNFSAPHVSGSFNLLAINGPSIINSSKKILIKFFHFSHGLTVDISKAYRSIWITPKSQSLSRFFWVENKDDITSMKECLWTKCTYGSGPTGIYMEIILREPVAESTSKPEVKTLLNDNRFMDDLGASDHDPIRLVEEVKEYIRVCSEYGFEHGEVSSTNNVFEGSEKSQIRTMLGIKWDPKTDLYTPNSEWNISAKSRGTYKEKSLKLMSDNKVQNIVVTKTLTSRLLG